MPNLISISSKKIKPKGLNLNSLPDQKRIKNYFFADEYENLKLLNKLLKLTLKENPLLFYPGSSSDILTPLIYLETLFPQIKQARFIFVDEIDCLNLIKKILDEINISFSEKNNQLNFYWNQKLINLKFVEADVFRFNLPKFDIYFEKAFRIMKDNHLDYENKIFEKLNQKGILISDSGFQHLPLKKIEISQKLSSYQEMIIGIK